MEKNIYKIRHVLSAKAMTFVLVLVIVVSGVGTSREASAELMSDWSSDKSPFFEHLTFDTSSASTVSLYEEVKYRKKYRKRSNSVSRFTSRYAKGLERTVRGEKLSNDNYGKKSFKHKSNSVSRRLSGFTSGIPRTTAGKSLSNKRYGRRTYQRRSPDDYVRFSY